MKRNILFISIVLVTLGIGIAYGIAIQKYHIFPYPMVKMAKNYVHNEEDALFYGPWSVGVYTGSSPFVLHDPESISNPVLTAKDVTDIDAQFIADPFLAMEDNRWYMFFEVLNRANSQGDIGYAESGDGKNWEYKNIIIDEPFHLSYPYVFKWEDQYYLIPESSQDLSIRLYRATSFPGEWQFVKRLFHGEHYVDPSIFRHDNTWWMFFTSPANDALNLYYADQLTGTWLPHPMNPIVKLDKHISRPGGRVIVHDHQLYRFAQDTDPWYGIQIFAFEIEELSKTLYKERLVSEKPVVTKSGEGWNAYGMHHVDLHFLNGQWIATVDGRCSPSSRIPCQPSLSTRKNDP
jgi:hypothetical protein